MESYVFSFLPPEARAIALAVRQGARGEISEVHLRADAYSSLTVRREAGEENLPLPFCLSEREMREILSLVCGGSVYAFEESIKEGYVTLPGGLRVGVGGRAVLHEGRAFTLSGARSLCFRIPHAVRGAADRLLSFFKQKGEGILLFAPPGGGKTTLLRELARELSRGTDARRCAVIDTRGEFCGFDGECLLDVLSGYPKALGAQIAVRTLSPELLIMDELGKEDVSALLSLSSLGVPVLASVHGKSAAEVKKSAVEPLLSRGVFSYLWDVRANAPLS